MFLKIAVTCLITDIVQVFANPPVDTNIKISEGDSKLETYKLNRLNFTKNEGMKMNNNNNNKQNSATNW